MSTIQFGGVISGLNTQGIIDALVAVKKQPLTDLLNKEASLTAQKIAYAQVGTALDDLVAKIQNFTVTSAGAGRVGTSADNSIFTATAAANAAVSQYQISVDRLATATRATSTGAIGAAVTDTSETLQALNLPGTVTAGQISAVVNGVIVHYTVGNPATTTLDQVMAGLGQAIQNQLQAGGANTAADPTATVTVSVVGNRLQIALSGATLSHSLSFGAAGDSSNALGMLGIANSSATIAVNDPPLTGTTNLGVARLTGALDSAGLAGLTSTTTGKLTINGVDIAYNTTTDTLSSIISRMNNSTAGVIASIDRTNDKLILTRKDTGALALDIQDTSGNLGATLKLAPGTTNAQTIGLTAKVTVDGRSITSITNTVTNAIDGVTLNLVTQSPLGLPQTLSVGVDQSAVTSALNSLITSFNSLGDTLDKVTASTPGQAGGTAGTSGPLASDPTTRSLFLSLRATLFQATGTGSINSLGAIGLSTGAIGAVAGSTDRLQLDTTKLTAALNTDANQVASLLDGSTGPIAALLAKLKSFEDPANTSSYIQSHTTSLSAEISSIHREELNRQEMIDNYQKSIEAQYAAMEATLAQLQSQSAQISATLGYSTTSSGTGLGGSSTNG
ncbi:MAG TPA: flagellar filament capping protein FliD [Candidatus Limnocylindrales bacterium]